jgi:hypothetical protein
MHLASDYIHPTPRGGRCRIRIYLPEEEQDTPIVICSELPNNGGTPVTYAAEQLAAEVIRSHKITYSFSMDRALAEGEHGRRGGELRVGRLL